MKVKKGNIKLFVVFLIVILLVPSIYADYYKSDFFPIGLTGLGYTGSGTPYGNVYPDPWTWDQEPRSEKKLIDDLGINCIGCEDAWQNALIDFAQKGYETYLTEVCMELTENDPPTVYLITASYGAVPKRFDKNIIFKYTEANL